MGGVIIILTRDTHCANNLAPRTSAFALVFPSLAYCTAEEVGHAYGRARNAVSRMVSKHCKISVATALEVHFLYLSCRGN